MSLFKTAFLSRDQHVLKFSHCADHFFINFQQGASVCSKQRFLPEISTFPHFRIGGTTFLAIFNKLPQFVQNSVLSPRSARIVNFALVHHLLTLFSKSARVCPKSKTVLLARTLLITNFQQSALFCTKHRFHLYISVFCHFRSGHSTS